MDQREKQAKKTITKIVFGIITFHFVCFCWVLFRAKDMETVYLVLQQIGTNFALASMVQILLAYKSVIIVLLLGYTFHLLPQTYKSWYQEKFIALPEFNKALLIVIICLFLLQIRSADLQPFIYFQF